MDIKTKTDDVKVIYYEIYFEIYEIFRDILNK